MATCDSIDVDLSPVDFDVAICSTPNFDVEILQADLTLDAVSIAGQGPKGDQGDQGDQGVPGTPGAPGEVGPSGAAATLVAGLTTTTAPGTNALVSNSGSTSAAVFDFEIPRGDKGDIGQGIVIKGSVPNHGALPPTGNQPGDVWIATDTGHGWAWNGTAWVDIGPIQGPPGQDGPPGVDGQPGVPGVAGSPGAAATVAAGTTTTGAPGTNAAVINTGTSSAAVFAFTIPRGDVGAVGPAGSPGGVGSPGAPGAAGGNAWTLVTNASFTVPAYGANVTVQAGDTSWVALGEWVYIDDAAGAGVAGQLIVTAKTPSTLTLFNPTPSTYPLASTTQAGMLCQVSGKTTDFVDGTNNCQPIAPQITAVRLRSFNAIGNPSFEVDQRNTGTTIANINNFGVDRWFAGKAGTSVISAGQLASTPVVPGTSFVISRVALSVKLTTAQASLGASDFIQITQSIEGPNLRELIADVHSISLLVRSSVAGLNFSVRLTDSPTTKSLVKLCNIPAANSWTLITLPNLPIFPSGNFTYLPGAVGYTLGITLAAGTSLIAPAADTWQSGAFIGAPGTSNFANSPVNSTFDVAMVQHEPGAVCSTLIDKPFSQNLNECLRYYGKSYSAAVKPGTITPAGAVIASMTAGNNPLMPVFYKQVMANVATVTGYSTTSGAANIVRDTTAGLEKAITGANGPGDSGFSGFAVTSPNAANWQAQFQWTADTGW